MLGKTTRSVAAAFLVLAAVPGCSGGADSAPPAAAPGPSASSPSASSPSSSPSPPAEPSASAPGGPPPTSTPAPVARGVPVQVPVERPEGLPEAERLRAPTVPFERQAVYDDGVTLAVRDVAHATTRSTGAGAQPGQPVTSLTVELRNGSPVPVDLTGVVVSAVSGAQQAPASPVYGEGQQDFAGIAAPGSALAATYSFTIPPSELDDVTVTVDFDGRHAPAVWRGSLR